MRLAVAVLVATVAVSACFAQPVKQAAAPRVAGDDLGYRIGQIDAKIDNVNSAIKDLRDLVLKVQQERVVQGNRITDLERQAKVGGFVLAGLFVAVLGQLVTAYFKPRLAEPESPVSQSPPDAFHKIVRSQEIGDEGYERTINKAHELIAEYEERDAGDPRRERLLRTLFETIRTPTGGKKKPKQPS